MRELLFLHTAAPNESLFGELLKELDPTRPARHRVEPRLLADALAAGGPTPAVQAQIETILHEEAASDRPPLVVCTCSTIGGLAEAAGEAVEADVYRIDRAMAETAVAIGGRIVLAACLATTLGPTESLVRSAALAAGRQVDIRILLIEDAWAKFLAGERQEYWRLIAERLRAQAADADVIVLAQASMAGAADLCGELTAPILSSPRLGLTAALQR